MGSLVYVLHAVLFKFCRYTLLFLSGQNSPPNPWVKNWWIRKQYSHTLIAQASFNRRVSCRIHMCRCHCHHYPFDYHQKWYCNWSPWEPREIILITFTMIQCLCATNIDLRYLQRKCKITRGTCSILTCRSWNKQWSHSQSAAILSHHTTVSQLNTAASYNIKTQSYFKQGHLFNTFDVDICHVISFQH